ncbi:hypothetical protein P3G55_17615 [Leptospira sp. 96542]|nr:hypothetical protein [Leptospira sp. 96542]
MSILSPKLDPQTFNDIYGLIKKNSWLEDLQSQLIELWNFCEYKEESDLLIELIDRFKILDLRDLNELGKNLYEKTVEFNLPVGSTYLTATAEKGELDGSAFGLDLIKNKFPSAIGWKTHHFSSNLVDFAHKVPAGSSVILFDDFIGSGKTIIRKINYFLNKLKERNIQIKKIYIFSFAALEEGILNIKSQHQIEIYVPIILKKGITDFNNSIDTKKKINTMLNLEKKLKPTFSKLKLEDHSLGYKKSEALYTISGKNCPNNVFPIFWWPLDFQNNARSTLFTRLR